MKCDQCGFVSFDYLSECRRCSADLTGTREQLGFSSLKSEVPFLLGALLKGGSQRDGLTEPAGGGKRRFKQGKRCQTGCRGVVQQ